MMHYLPIVIALILAIALSFKTGINGGLYALAFAFIMGCFCYGYTPQELLNMWPVSLCFVLFSVNFFYNFAVLNGTMDKLATKVLYLFRGIPQILPFAIFVVAFVVSALGAGFLGTLAMLDPIAYGITKKSDTNPIAAQLSVQYGGAAGGAMFTSSTGAAARTLISDAGYEGVATEYSLYVMIATLLIGIVFVIIAFMVYRKDYQRADMSNMEKPEAFDQKQRKTLLLIGIMIIALLLPYFLHLFLPGNAYVVQLAKYMDVGFICIVLSVVAIILKVGDEKAALQKVSWSIILLISGISILVALASDLGMIDALSKMISASDSKLVAILLITLLAGVMSVFSSTNGVVMPTLFPGVPAFAAATGLSPVLLFSAIKVGAIATGNSVLSSAGGISLASAPDEKTKNYCYKAFCITPFIGIVIALIAVGVVSVIFF